LAKIAVAMQQAIARREAAGGPGDLAARVLGHGDGWVVEDVICTAGPTDRPFEERHAAVSIAIVAAGSFQYRASGSAPHRDLLTPGSLLLGNPGQCFECGHAHGTGDRCVAFGYAPDYFHRLAADAGIRGSQPFRVPAVPPLRALAPVAADACAAVSGTQGTPLANAAWEELSMRLAAATLRTVHGLPAGGGAIPPNAAARVTRAVRIIERHLDAELALGSLARAAGLSPYHFLRVFVRLTGVTPHQYVLRARLRDAAVRLVAQDAKVVDTALDCGFGDVSNFNRAFRTEFGVSPRQYRQKRMT
jgi:AraC-like DNA-binding protein